MSPLFFLKVGDFNLSSLPVNFLSYSSDKHSFEYLLDVVEVHDREELGQIICNALVHQKYNYAFAILMTKGFFEIIDKKELLLCAIALADDLIIADRTPVELAQFLLGHLRDDMEIDEELFHFVICACIEERRMDILSYINKSIREIDIVSYIYFFVVVDDEESIEFL